MIRSIGKKLTSLALAAAITVSTAVAVSAATTTTLPYGVKVTGKKLSLTKSGKAVAGYALKSTDVAFTTGKTGNLLLNFIDSTGKSRYISLGKQTTMNVEGTLNSVSVKKALQDDVVVSIGTTANVTKLSVASPNKISVSGKVSTMNLSAAAKVTVRKGAKVTKTTKTDAKATVTVEKGAAVTKPTVAKNPVKTSKPTKTSTAKIRLEIDPLEGNEDDRLLDLLDDLNDNVYAYDTRTYDTVEGECTWNYPRYAELDDDDRSYPFTFTPNDESYEPVKSKVMIYVDGAFGDISLHYDTKVLSAKDGDKLRDLTDALEDAVEARDDNGDLVKGSFKWDSSSSTEVREGRSYDFTFKPRKSSRYDSEDGSIEIKFKD